MHQSLFQLAHLPKSASPEDAAQLGCGGESLQSISEDFIFKSESNLGYFFKRMHQKRLKISKFNCLFHPD